MKSFRFVSAVGLAMVLSLGLLRAPTYAANKATVSVTPQAADVGLRKSFSVDVQVNTNDETVSGADMKIEYSKNLKFERADTVRSVFPVPVKEVKESNNVLTFSRVRTDKGYKGSDGNIIRLTFKPTSPGKATVIVNAADSRVLLYADSSNILLASVNGSYNIGVLGTYSPAGNVATVIVAVVVILVVLMFVAKRRRQTISGHAKSSS